MDIHKNARLTLRRREDLVEYVARGAMLKLAAANFSIAPKTAAKWVHRFRGQGTPGLLDRSSRPLRSPRRTSSSLTEEVIALRYSKLNLNPSFCGLLRIADTDTFPSFPEDHCRRVSWISRRTPTHQAQPSPLDSPR